jgi:hypothetical protein
MTGMTPDEPRTVNNLAIAALVGPGAGLRRDTLRGLHLRGAQPGRPVRVAGVDVRVRGS